MPALPRGILAAALSQEDRRSDAALAADVEQQAAPVRQRLSQGFSLPSLDDLLGSVRLGSQQQAPAEQPSRPVPPASAFQMPDLTTLLGPLAPKPETIASRTATTPSATGIAGTQDEPPNLPGMRGPVQGPVEAVPGPQAASRTVGPGEIETYIRQAAAKRGINPDVAVRVALAEGGLDDPVRQSDFVYRGRREESYGPLQLNIEGGLGSAALAAGIDPRNPAHWRQAVDFALDNASRGGWGPWHGAARVGIGDWEGIRSGSGAPTPTAGAAQPSAPAAPAPPAASLPAGGASDQIEIRNPINGAQFQIPRSRWPDFAPGGFEIVGQAASAQMWSPDQPSSSPVAAQMSTGRRGGGTMSLPEPMPEGSLNPAVTDPGSRNVVPHDPATGETSDSPAVQRQPRGWTVDTTLPEESSAVSYRQPLADQTTASDLPYDARDVDQGEHEAIPLGPREPEVPAQPESPFTPPSSGLQAVYDAAGNFLHWIAGNVAQNRQNVEQANEGQSGGVDFGTGIQRAATDIVQPAIASAGQAATEAANETGTLPQIQNAGDVLQAANWLRNRLDPLSSYNEIAGAALSAFGYEVGIRVAAALGVPDTEIANVFGHSITPRTVAGAVGSVALDPTSYVGAGEVRPTARAIGEAARRAGTRVAEEVAPSAERAVAEVAPSVERSLVSTVPEAGETWADVSRRLQQEADQAAQHAEQQAQARRAIPSDQPAEQAIRESYGRPVETLASHEQGPATRGMYQEAVKPPGAAERVSAEDAANLSRPVTQAPDVSDRLNVTPGVSAGFASRLGSDVANAAGGGVYGAAIGAGAPADTPEDRGRNALIGAGVGMVAGPTAGRLIRRGEGALATPGVTPNAGPRRAAGIPGQQAIKMTPAEEVGRLRLDKFPAELRPEIQRAAESTGFAHDARRGVIPDAVAEQTADGVNRTVDDWITKSKVGRSLNTEETRALRNLVTGQAQKVDDLAREIADAEAGGVVTDLLIARAHQEGEKLASLVSVMEGARAEAGRSMRAWRQETRPTNPTEAAQRIFNKFGGGPEGRQRALDALKEFNEIPADDPIARAGFWARVERGGKITGTDVLTAIRYNSMLSSPRTWEIGWIGSILQAPLKIGNDILAATSRPLSGELGEAARGAVMGAQAGLRPLWETIRYGITSDQALAGQLPRGLAARATSTTGKVLGTAIDLPGRMVAAPDAFFTQLFKGMETGRQAAIAAYKAGLKGDQRAELIQNFTTNTPRNRQAEIDRVVDDLMLRGDMGRFGRWASGVATKDPLIGSFVAPFMKVSYHIWTQGMDLTPAGVLGTGVDVLRGAYRNGARPIGVRPLGERARYNAIGLGITGAATWQAMQGNVSGAGPDDPEKRDELRATGWQPYSIKLGDTWVSYANWGPVAVPLSLAAAYAENQQYKKPNAKPEDQMFDMAKRVTQLVTEQTFLQGIGTIMNAFEDPQRYLPQLLAQQASSLIPYGSGLNTVGQSQDDYQRRPERPADVGVAESLAQSVKSRIPINPLTPDRGDVPIAQDPLGHQIQNQQSGPIAFQPFRISQQRDDHSAQIARAFLDLGLDISKPPSSFTEDGVKIEMTPEQQRAYQRYMGEAIERGFDRANNASDRRRAEQIKTLYEDARSTAQARIRAEIGRSEIRNRVRTGAR